MVKRLILNSAKLILIFITILCLCIVFFSSLRKKTTSSAITTPATPVPSPTTATTYGPTTPVTTSSPAPSTTAAPTTTAAPVFCDTQYSCADCWTSRICAPTASGRLQQIALIDCPANYWCDPSSSSCTPLMPDSCAPNPPLVGSFPCMREGYFPHPLNCSTYYHCKQPDYIPYLYICPVTTPYYDPYFQTCMANMTHCNNYTSPCDGYTGLKVAVLNTTDMFILCDDGQPLNVDRCIGAYQFNVTSQNCEPACPHAGLFPSDEDCTKYYRCSPTCTPDTFSMTLNLTCPTGQAFLEQSYECVDKQLVPNCNTSALGLFNIL